jgi:hypothetical protein
MSVYQWFRPYTTQFWDTSPVLWTPSSLNAVHAMEFLRRDDGHRMYCRLHCIVKSEEFVLRIMLFVSRGLYNAKYENRIYLHGLLKGTSNPTVRTFNMSKRA